MRTVVFIISHLLIVAALQSAEPTAPRVRDERLRIELFAGEPEIVTPIGIAVDGRGRVFVIESHTHMPPRDYAGPKTDRVKVFADRGQTSAASVFAEGFRDAMGIAIGPDERVYVVHRTGVVALTDRDGDGRAEGRAEILRLETRETYSHNGLLGVAYGSDGWLYVSRGNVGGHAWTLIGSDGRRLSGYGDGGAIVRCRPDGSGLEPVAGGFWNPFALDFDRAGRLLAVDNDPDARGPNRLVHVIRGGDYGFKARFGGSGLHPYDAWDGERPGTLPMAAGTGEAPSGILAGDRAALPRDYRDDVLVTLWGTHRVARYRLRRHGTSLRGAEEAILEGGSEFRPVGIAAGPDGSVWITDWVKRDYPNHGFGRIWKLSATPGVEVAAPRRRGAPPLPDDGTRLLESIPSQTTDELGQLLGDPDPFVRGTAVTALAEPDRRDWLLRTCRDPDPRRRLGAILALRRIGMSEPIPFVRTLLSDPDPEIRVAALMWAGEAMLMPLADDIARAIAIEPVQTDLFRVYLATADLLTSRELERFQRRDSGFRIRRAPPAHAVDRALTNPGLPATVRAVALTFATEPERALIHEVLLAALEDPNPELRMEAVRTLAKSTQEQSGQTLLRLALDLQLHHDLRAEAIHGLIGHPNLLPDVIPLLSDPVPAIRAEAVRSLGTVVDLSWVRDRLSERLAVRDLIEGERELIRLVLGLTEAGADGRPSDEGAWWQLVKGGGDVKAGRRVFFHPRATCATCHSVHGRGGQVGPELSRVGQVMDRRTLLHHILKPSEEIAQEYQGYVVELSDGRTWTGTQFHLRGDRFTMILTDGREISHPLADVESYQPLRQSLMPEGLADRLAVAELRDLLAFLEKLR